LLDYELFDVLEESLEKVCIYFEQNRTHPVCGKFVQISAQRDPQSYAFLAIAVQLYLTDDRAKAIGNVLDVQFEVVLILEKFHMNSGHVANQFDYLQLQFD